ncbi:MAG: alpha/beta-hydrolase family protein [Actinobacteria bacterium]|nr:alpha/beta-hydrolase family protein [Actinomycetota bacterium]MCB8997759.1 alpha/beta-hydrolase family protein [Actinomycetota bacterium]
MEIILATATEPPPTVQQPSPLPRVFSLRFSGVGMWFAGLFFAFSLFPSLLPRAGYVQGVASGITIMIGYLIGVGIQTLWRYLQIPALPARPGKWLRIGAYAFLALTVVSAIWQYVGWQNEVRSIFDKPAISPTAWPVIVLVTVVVAALILIIARSLRKLAVFGTRLLGRILPPRLAQLISVGVIAALLWSLVTGVLVNAFFGGANAVFSVRDTATTEGTVETTSTVRSGGPDSLVSWESLGRKGRDFVGTGPTVEQINEFTGGGAKEPIRAYVGLDSEPTLQGRADLLLEELQRTGAFDREVLVVATTTGTGFLDPMAVDPVEYMWNGDTAIAGVQYSFLPSWISLLADQQAVKETSRTVFNTVHDYWSTLPEDARPDLYLYGLSLGSYGVESILTSISLVNEPIDGAFMSGPPFVNPLHDEIEGDRDPGSPAWLPEYEDGRTVQFTSSGSEIDEVLTTNWGPTRLVYLQHSSDPVVFFNQNLALEEPEWLLDGQRGPDIPEEMTWVPIVTMWQVALDLPAAGSVPIGHGHMYSPQSNAEAWAAMTQPPGWTSEQTKQLVTVMQAQGTAQ